jgi:hypothetical protein
MMRISGETCKRKHASGEQLLFCREQSVLATDRTSWQNKNCLCCFISCTYAKESLLKKKNNSDADLITDYVYINLLIFYNTLSNEKYVF